MHIGLVVLVLNCVSPGLGTLVSAYYVPVGCSCKLVTFAFLQGITAIVIAGYVWSVMYGLAVYRKAEANAVANGTFTYPGETPATTTASS